MHTEFFIELVIIKGLETLSTFQKGRFLFQRKAGGVKEKNEKKTLDQSGSVWVKKYLQKLVFEGIVAVASSWVRRVVSPCVGVLIVLEDW